jgi:phage terminase large subunit
MLELLFTPNKTWRIAWGGRSSGKSWSFVRALIVRSLEKKIRILCCREIQRSIKSSIWQLIVDQIELLGLGEIFDTTRDEIRCLRTGSTFQFIGLATNTVESVKSYEGVSICFVDEAQVISKHSWDVLIPTIRKTDCEIWCSMNPELETDPSYIMLVKNWHLLDRAICVNVNYTDNPYFSQKSRKDMESCRNRSMDEYRHIWLGETVKHTESHVFNFDRIHLQRKPIEASWSHLVGVDWGYAADPCVMVDMYYDISTHSLYIANEIVIWKAETASIPDFFIQVPNIRDCVIRADQNRPEQISACRRFGFKRMLAGKKWKGNHEDGVDYLRGLYDIYINPDCVQTYYELTTLRYKVDKLTDQIQPEIDDKQRRNIEIDGVSYNLKDDCLDAIIYACEPLILGFKQKVPGREADPQTDQYGQLIRKPQSDAYARQQFQALGTNWMNNL